MAALPAAASAPSNPDLERLQPYPFERLRALFAGVTPSPAHAPIALSIGEPRHPTPPFILRAYADALASVAQYPATAGEPALRAAIAGWMTRRYGLAPLDPATEVLPVNGSREALFAIAQAVVDRSRQPLVAMPDPFYQIYEGAALLAGAEPVLLPTTAADGFRLPLERLDAAAQARLQLIYVCSPGNPTGRVLTLDEWRELFALSDRTGCVIAADECYSEIYFDEAAPPLGALQAAQRLGRSGYPRLLSFSSLSKRSNVPGLRSGFVAGDAALIRRFLLYRTYHGSAMAPPVQAASIAAWSDEAHVRDNRALYARKFEQATPLIARALPTRVPDAAFYLWARTPIADTEYARRLLAARNVTVLPGSFLARPVDGHNPGADHVRIALVASPAEVAEAAERIASFQP